MDIRLPGMDGIEATRLITGGDINARVLVLTTFDDDDYVYGALRATAKTHVARLLVKLAARDRVQLVITACETGLVSAPH
jgi:DNA-binding NarL/FixJ family response regulator